MGTTDARTRKSRSSQNHNGTNKKQHGSCYSLSPNSLWSVWYCIIIVAMQIYIIAVSIKCFGRYIALPWPIEDQPYLELNAYVGFLGASVVIMPFFIAAAILRIGNYPNDGRKICSQSTSLGTENFAVYENVKNRGKEKRARVLWRHGVPLAPFLHVASAFCLMLPKVLIQAQLIKHGFLKKGELWSSELDFVIAHRDRLVSLSFLPTVNDTEIWVQEARKIDVTSTPIPQVQLDDRPVAISAEFLNFGTSLLIYAIRYPSVFWSANKLFGFLFSFQLLLNGLQQLLAFTGFSVLYKIQIFNPAGALMRYTPPLMNSTTTMLLFFIYNAAMTAASCSLHCYGLQKHREWVERRLRAHHHMTWGSGRWRLWGYTPQLFAFVVLVILASSGVPFIYDFTIVYWGSLDGVVLAAVTGTVAHLFLWIVLWLFLTVKQRWTFYDGNRRVSANANCHEDGKYSSCNGHATRDRLTGVKDFAGDPPPLLVIDRENTYQIREKSCQKAILSLANQSFSRQKTSSSTDDEDIYWLKPRLPTPKDAAESLNDDIRSKIWIRSQVASSASSNSANVVQEESHLNTFPSKRKSSIKSSRSSVGRSMIRSELEDFSEAVSEDGDYAILSNHQEYDRREGLEMSTWKGVAV